MSVFFNGQELVTPTTASVVNDDAMQNQNPAGGNSLIYVGKSLGGQPGVKLDFGSPEEAKALLRGGEGLDAVVKAFAPSADTGAPQTVSFLRVNPAVQAAAPMKGAGSVTVLNLKARNYGQKDNTIKVTTEAGSLSGKRITVEQGNSYFTADNVGREAFTVIYSGSESTATVDVTASSVVLKAGSAVTETISLADFASVGDLVDKINTLPGFAAEVMGTSANSVTLNGLDFVAAQDVKTKFTVRADLQAIVDWLNGGSQYLVTATRADNVGILPADGYVYLAGGSEGVTTIEHWADAFEAVQRMNVQWITPLSGDPAIHAMADAHVVLCSDKLKRERRSVCGTVANTDNTDAKAQARALNSKRTSLVHIGHYEFGLNSNKLELRPAYMTAALIAAMFAASNPGTPMTNKLVTVRGWERDLLNPTETDDLIKGGVLCVENTSEGYKVVRSISTWLGDNKYNNVEQSTGAAVDFTMVSWRAALDVLRGQKSNPLLLQRSITISEGILKELARPEPEGLGVLVGDAGSPPYRNLSATLQGDVLRVQGEISPAIPNNYILVTAYLQVYSGTATA